MASNASNDSDSEEWEFVSPVASEYTTPPTTIHPGPKKVSFNDNPVEAIKFPQTSNSSLPAGIPRQNTVLPQGQTQSQATPPVTPSPLWGRCPRPTPLLEPTPEGPIHSDNTSRLATSILAKLQTPKPHTRSSTAWGPEDAEILATNIALLQEVTAPTQLAGQKRRHSDPDDPYDSDLSSDDDTRPNTTTIASDRHINKKVRNNKRYVKPPVDLAELAPQPLRIDYKSHPIEERSDQWFITMFNKLFQMCETFTETFFNVHDLEQGDFYSPWEDAAKSPEFIHWASLVAEEDPVTGGWDFVLRNSRQRKWLVMGILVRIIKIKIFDDDLWGAEEEEYKLLHGIERAFLSREGFQRTLVRSSVVRQILDLRHVTENFYPEVASLTAQVSLLFKPLADFLYSIPPVENKPLPNFTNQYQALHNIISTAAYLSLCMRTSNTIFFFNEPSLGERFDPADQWNLEMEYYTQSREAVVKSFKTEWKEWLLLADAAQRKIVRLEEEGKMYTKSTAALADVTRRVWTKEYKKASQVKSDVDKQKPEQPGLMYRPMCKMSVWPVITRYKAGSEEDEERENEGEKIMLQHKDGFQVFQISKAAVVSYFGEVERKGRVGLEEHLRTLKAAKGNGLVGTIVMGTVAAAVLGVSYALAVAG